jgi:hypothetical protein
MEIAAQETGGKDRGARKKMMQRFFLDGIDRKTRDRPEEGQRKSPFLIASDSTKSRPPGSDDAAMRT